MPSRLSAAQRTLVERARHPGVSDMGVALTDADCGFLIATIAKDLGVTHLLPSADFNALPPYFEVEPVSDACSLGLAVEDALVALFASVQDADTYFACLASLHKSRLKYEQILRRQPLPTFDQVGPRGLLQFGTLSSRALVALLMWRKWLYDLDNRAAQDTGYLFEPILASSIGGFPAPAKRSPVKRRSDGRKGRQVDCVRGKRAYEFKLRVTIAASGQGRWGEELAFPHDCKASGYTPVLVVLDPTPNPKLTELIDQFQAAGGEAYIGDDAWAHLEGEAGATMAVFLERYVREPLAVLLAEADTPLDEFSVSFASGSIALRVGEEVRTVVRAEEFEPDDDAELPEDVDSELPGL